MTKTRGLARTRSIWLTILSLFDVFQNNIVNANDIDYKAV